jgi:hypothetical protein
MNKKEFLLESLKKKNCLKVISGINNFDLKQVMDIAEAAYYGQATCIDICAEPRIIKSVLEKYSDLPVFVSSVKIEELKVAQEMGADVLELGNYEAFHQEGIFFESKDIIKLSKELVKIRKHSLLSVTVPGHLEISEQIKLASELEELGVEIIQTEGAALTPSSKPGILGQIEKVCLTLANTLEISKVLEKTYLLTASGLNPDTASLAIASGASGIGAGKYISKKQSALEKIAAIQALKNSINLNSKQTNEALLA